MKFYVLCQRETSENKAFTEFSHSESFNTGDAPTCPVCGAATGMLTWITPYAVQLDFRGNQLGDIVFGTGNELLVSERFKQLYKDTDLTGLYNFEPVEIVKVKRRRRLTEPVPQYYCVHVVRSRVAVDEKASELVRAGTACSECRIGGTLERWQRVVFEKDTWAGEDIFYARGLPGDVFTSERFRDFCIQNDIRNAHFIPADQYYFDFYPWEVGEDLRSYVKEL